MKIAYDAKRIFCNRTGLGNYGRTLVKNYHAEYPEDELVLFTPKTDIAFLDDEWKVPSKNSKVKVITPEISYMKKFHPLWRSFYLSKEIKKETPHIYHGLSHELPTGMETLIKTTKSVVTIHDLIYLRYPHYFPFIDRVIYDAKFRHACESADSIVAICEQTASDIEEYFNISREKITVLHQSIDDIFYIKRSANEKEIVQKKYQIPKDFILFVGTLEERKNPLIILEALNALKKRLVTPLVIVGDGGKYKKMILEAIKKYDLEKDVFMLGHIDFKDLSVLYQMASLFVFPSIFEGFGLPVVEALASGTPVITSQGSSFPEAGGNAAKFIDPLDVDDLIYNMELVLTDTELKSKMIQNGLEHVKKFESSFLAKKLKNHYQSLL